MGPIERELRAGVSLENWQSSDVAIRLCAGAADELGYESMLEARDTGAWPDVLTEAICAAEALGL